MALLRFDPRVSDPVSSLLALQSELDRFLRNPGFNLGLSGYGAFPAVNIFDDGQGIVVVAEVPGLDSQSIKVTSQGQTLTLTGERPRDDGNEVRGYHRRERPFGQFSRSIQLPEGVDPDKAGATYEAGILTIRVPRAEHAKPRQIEIQTR
jgi:HSP20 family protein